MKSFWIELLKSPFLKNDKIPEDFSKTNKNKELMLNLQVS